MMVSTPTRIKYISRLEIKKDTQNESKDTSKQGWDTAQAEITGKEHIRIN